MLIIMINQKKGQSSILGIFALLIVIGAFSFAYGLVLSMSNSSLGQSFAVFGAVLIAVGIMILGVLGKS